MHRRRFYLLAGIVLIGLGFRLWGIAWGLQDANVSRRPHPDEWAIFWLFHWFDRTQTLNPCPSPGTRCFFDWGSVYPYLAYGFHFLLQPLFAALPSNLFGARADHEFVQTMLSGRLFSVLASTATVVLTYRLGVLTFGVGSGLVAALGVALSGLLIQLAHFATPDATTGMFMTAALLGVFVAAQRPSLRTFVGAGAMVGLAAGTEYHMVLLGFPLLGAWLMSANRRLTWPAGAACAALAAYVLSNPYALVDAGPFLGALEHTIRIRTVDSGIQYQGRWAAYDPGWLYVVRYPLGYGVGFAFAIWLIFGFAWSCLKRRRADLLLLCWIVPYFLLVSFSSAKFMRYSAPLLPPLAVLGGRFLVTLFASRPLRSWRPAGIAVAIVAFLYTGAYDAAYAGLFSTPDSRSTATAWLDQHVPKGKAMWFEQLPNGLVNLPYFVTSSGYQPCIAQFRPSRLAKLSTYLLTDDYDLEDHAEATTQQVDAFRSSVQDSGDRVAATQFANVPTFLGLKFPIAASPHDWRYPAHVITIYKLSPASSLKDNAAATRQYCYSNLTAAVAALYIRRTVT